MHYSSKIKMFLLGLLAVVIVTGCAGYGKIRPVFPEKDDSINISVLIENWQNYDIWRGGSSSARPSGILFDPKGDQRAIVADRWSKVEDRRSLLEAVRWLGASGEARSILFKILGPDDEFFGYVYTGSRHVPMRLINENTMYVYYLPHFSAKKGAKE